MAGIFSDRAYYGIHGKIKGGIQQVPEGIILLGRSRCCSHSRLKACPRLLKIHAGLFIKSSGIKAEVKFCLRSREASCQLLKIHGITGKIYAAIKIILSKIRDQLRSRSQRTVRKVACEDRRVLHGVRIISFIRFDSIINCKLLRSKGQGGKTFFGRVFIKAFKIRMIIKIAVELIVLGRNRALGEPAVNLGFVGRVAAAPHCFKAEPYNFIFGAGKVQPRSTFYEPVDFTGSRKLPCSKKHRVFTRKKLKQIFGGSIFFLKISKAAQGFGTFSGTNRRAFFDAALEFFAGSILVALLQKAQANKVVCIVAKFFLTLWLRCCLTGQGVEYKNSNKKIIRESAKITETTWQRQRRCHEAPTQPELQSLFQK